MYFDKDWSGGNKCKLVTWQTQYSSIARDDYKRCVCDVWGSGASDCPQGDNDTSNQSEVESDQKKEESEEEVVEESSEEEVVEESSEEEVVEESSEEEEVVEE